MADRMRLRRLGTPLALVVGVCLAFPGAAGAFEAPWVGAGQAVVSSDGRHMYVAGNQTLTFRRTGEGRLEEISDIEPGGEAIAISPDGRSVYVGGLAWLHLMRRDPRSGLLTHVRTIDTGSIMSDQCCNEVAGLAVSPDGRFVHATLTKDESLVTYARDPETSDLSRLDVRPSVAGASLTMTDDGRHLYTAGSGVALFERDTNGRPVLRQTQGTAGWVVRGLALSHDERRLVTVSGDVILFERDGESGTLGEPRTFSMFGAGSGSGSPSLRHSAVAAQDGSLYVLNATEDAIIHARFQDGGGLGVVRSYSREADGLTHLADPHSVTMSADGRALYVAVNGVPSGPYPRAAAILRFAVDATTGALSYVDTVFPNVGRPGPRRGEKPYGSLSGTTTLERGAPFTNELVVDLVVDPPDGVASLRISDDRGKATPLLRLTDDGRYQFRMTRDRDDGPRKVKVTFTYAGRKLATPVVSDRIVVDREPPAVLGAHRSGRTLVVRARDDRAGVSKLQIARRRGSPDVVRRFRKRVRVADARDARWVRVVDRAKNRSRWRRIR